MNGMYNMYGQQPFRTPTGMTNYPPLYPTGQPIRTNYPPASEGRILYVNSYDDVRRASLPVDGSLTLFMIAGKSIFYTAYMQGDMPLVSGYSFTPLEGEQQTSNMQTSNENDLESRLKKLENFQREIMDMLGGNSNESNTSATNQPKQRK